MVPRMKNGAPRMIRQIRLSIPSIHIVRKNARTVSHGIKMM
jgi:hypothetical protein